MKTLFLALFSVQAFSSFDIVSCDLKINTTVEQSYAQEISIGQKVKFFDANELRVFVSRKSDSKFEVELFNAQIPSRTYSVGNLVSKKDSLELAIWDRQMLFEISCVAN